MTDKAREWVGDGVMVGDGEGMRVRLEDAGGWEGREEWGEDRGEGQCQYKCKVLCHFVV
jgi:hypothetical protein